MDKLYCGECRLCGKSEHTCIRSEVNGAAHLMVVGDYPGVRDEFANTLMQSEKEKYLWKALHAIEELQINRVHVSYALKCGGHSGKYKSKELTYCASKYLVEEVLEVKPQSVLLLGKTAMLAFGLKGAIKDYKGKIIDLEVTNQEGTESHSFKAVVTYPPSYVSMDLENLFLPFAEDVYRAYNLRSRNKEEVTTHVRIRTVEEFKKVLNYCLETKECCFDFETTKIDKVKGVYAEGFRATLLSISFQHGVAYTIPLEHFESTLSREEVIEIFKLFVKYIMANPRVIKVNHNIKFDLHVVNLYVPGYKLRGQVIDTMAMHHLVDENARHGLKVILPQYYPQFSGWEQDVKKKEWDKIPLDELEPYAAVDSDGTLRLKDVLQEILIKDERLYDIYRNYTIPATSTLFRMEQRGTLVDENNLDKYIAYVEGLLEKRVSKMREYMEVSRFQVVGREMLKQKQIAKLIEHKETLKTEKGKANVQEKINNLKAGITPVEYEVNFGSPEQMVQLLYTKYGFGYRKPLLKRKEADSEDTGLTGKAALLSLDDYSGFIFDFMIFKAIRINLNTFLKGFSVRKDANHKLHTTYGISTVVTHRLNSRSPNLQNISKHLKVKHEDVQEALNYVTKSFVPLPGHVIMAVDYSQLELRIIAEVANEPTMIAAYNNDEDLHAVTAAKTTGRTLEEFMALPDEIRGPLRTNAKPQNFGLCLAAGTKVTTSKGEVNIEDIVEGDIVLTHRGNWKKVTDTQKLMSDVMYTITTNTGKTISMTPDHMMLKYFPSANRKQGGYGWVEGKDLRINDVLVDSYLAPEEMIESIVVHSHRQPVYDITVEEDHSFIANELVSHNCYGQEAEGYMDYAKNAYGVHLTLQESKETRKNFFLAYPALPVWHKTYIAKAKKFKYVRNMFGAKRHLPNIDSPIPSIASQEGRYAVNAPIQGTGGMMTVFGMMMLERRLPESCKLFITVHDSILLYVPYHHIQYAAKIVRETLCNLPLQRYFGRGFTKVPIKVDIEISKSSWKEVCAYDEVHNTVKYNKEIIPLEEYLS